jgi:hypothetical protein
MMTGRLQLSSAAERLSRQTAGALLAAAVQALFVAALLLWAVPPLPLLREQREIFFRLVPAAPPAPPVRIIGAAPMRKPVASAPAPSPAAPSVAAPPSGIAGLGQSLFGCAPENYANLPSDARAHCMKPGEGLAYNRLPDMMGGHSHVKDNTRWANAMVHKQPLPMLPGGMLFPLVALGAVFDGSISEPKSAFRDPEQWPNEDDPRKFMPHSLDEQERAYDAWQKDHPIPPPQN